MKKKELKNKKIKIVNEIKKYYNKLNPREKKLVMFCLCIFIIYALASIKPLIDGATEQFSLQSLELQQAEQNKGKALNIINQYILLRKNRQEIEKNFEKNSFKEGHATYCNSLKTSDMTSFSIGQEQVRPFGKDFMRTTFKINFQAPSLATVVGYIKKLENEKRKYLMSELSIKKVYNRFAVSIEVNSIEKKK